MRNGNCRQAIRSRIAVRNRSASRKLRGSDITRKSMSPPWRNCPRAVETRNHRGFQIGAAHPRANGPLPPPVQELGQPRQWLAVFGRAAPPAGRRRAGGGFAAVAPRSTPWNPMERGHTSSPSVRTHLGAEPSFQPAGLASHRPALVGRAGRQSVPAARIVSANLRSSVGCRRQWPVKSGFSLRRHPSGRRNNRHTCSSNRNRRGRWPGCRSGRGFWPAVGRAGRAPGGPGAPG